MKPLNINTHGCDPVSSNCVIWQGPDIPCIKLCKGDSVSDVVYKLATELCEVLETLDVSTYNLPDTCFQNQQCNPTDFHALIQIIIDKICSVESTVSGERTAVVSGTCPDCVVAIPTCFQYTNEFGDLVTTMQLTDYVKAIGNKVCSLVNQINVLAIAVADHEVRITALENAPPPEITLPQIVPTCVILPPSPTDFNIVLINLEKQFCELRTALGLPSDQYSAINKQCLSLNTDNALGPYGGNMAALSGWFVTVTNMAQSISNMWLTVCDLRSAVKNIQLNCCPSGCDGIDIKLQATVSGGSLLKLYFTGTIPASFDECNVSGQKFNIFDALGNSIVVYVSITSYLNDPSGYLIDLSTTPLNPGADISVDTDACFKDSVTGTICQFCISYVVKNQSVCPSITLVPTGTTSFTYSFVPITVPGNYTLEVWNSSITALITSTTTFATNNSVISNTITGLTAGSSYYVRLKVTIGTSTTECPFQLVNTAPNICLPPSFVSAAISYPVECDTCGPALEFVSNPGANGWYVDDNSQFLYNRSGGVFNTIIEEEATIASLVPAPTNFVSTTISAGQYVIKTYNNVVPGGSGVIYIYDGGLTPTLVQTVTLRSGVYAFGVAYNAADNKVYFSSEGTLGNPGSANFCSLDLATLTLAYTLTGGPFVTTALLTYIAINEVTNEAYIVGGGGSYGYITVVDLGTYTVSATITATSLGDAVANWGGGYGPRLIEFDSTGNAWITMTNNGGTGNDIIVVDGSTYGLITFLNDSGLSYPDEGASGVFSKNITYYPGDNTPGSDRMFVLMNDGNIYTYLTTAPYTQTLYLNIVSTAVDSVLYSKTFDRLFVFNGLDVTVYNPQNVLDAFGTITLSGLQGAMMPYELAYYNQIVMGRSVIAPSLSNITYIGLDEDNIQFCSEGLVDMYISNEGPYKWNTLTSSWDSMSTTTVSYATPSPSQFTVTALLDGSVVTAALLISTDYGFSWQPIADTVGNLYANPATWALGRVYNNPVGTFYLKVTFTTTDECGLEGSIIIPGP